MSDILERDDLNLRRRSLLLSSALAVVGTEFDYVFKPPAPLVAALRSSIRRSLRAEFARFELSTVSDIHGEWVLRVPKAASGLNAPEAVLAGLGFQATSTGDWLLQGRIEGTRYLKNNAERSGSPQKTNAPYAVPVKPGTGFQGTGRMNSSPLSADQTGAVVFFFLVLLPLILIFDSRR